MHALPGIDGSGPGDEVEAITVSFAQLEHLRELARRQAKPDTPDTFALPHIIRSILDCFEDRGIDLTDAFDEKGLAHLGAARLRESQTPGGAGNVSAASSCSSAVRRSCRENRPARGRLRSGTPPR
jgi:hypothetical protein